ncbi:hypothetical protein QYF61_026161 [Mycteria americana]|uniref:Serine/threonine-protein kinase ULK4/RUNKEL HEAT repeats domain-containing protein n=1 Tax=Mycteria americana TaxID=33587 RepID=A0AAN7S4P8_MYCAM|nr:hypothetical protein QYF61_026161 [Mycteria americana]
MPSQSLSTDRYPLASTPSLYTEHDIISSRPTPRTSTAVEVGDATTAPVQNSLQRDSCLKKAKNMCSSQQDMESTLKELVYTESDLIITPIIDNPKIMKQVPVRFDLKTLHIPTYSAEKLSSMKDVDWNDFLQRVCSMLDSTEKNTGAARSKLNLLYYLCTVAVHKEVANRLISSQLAIILLTELIRENFRNSKLKQCFLPALGELLYLIASMEEKREHPRERCVVPSAAYTVLMRCLREGEDRVVNHLAAKIIENVCTTLSCHAQGFITGEIGPVLWYLFTHSTVDSLKITAVSHSSGRVRLVMYIERDSRKTTPGKEQQGGSEYLSKCLDLLIYHIVQELPGILGDILTALTNVSGRKHPSTVQAKQLKMCLPMMPVVLHLVTSQGWRLNHFPGQSVPMLDNPLGEEKFPNIQSKPPLAQLEAISSCPITCYLGEETDPHLSTTSFQVVVESDEVSPEPPFLQAKQSQLPQPLLIRLLLQTLHQLRCPSLYALQYLNIPLVVGGPKLNTVFEVRPHQCRVQGHNHFPSPAGHAIFDTGQDAIGLLGRLGTLLAHIQAAVNQHPQVLLCQAAFQPLFPKPVALHGVAVAQVQDLALGLVKPHTIHPSPSIQPVQVPLQSLPTLQQINTPTQLGVVCKLTESALDPFVQIIDKDVKQNWPQHRALGNTACDRPPTGVNSIHHHSLGPAVQPVLYPAKSTPVQAMSSQFLQENAVGNRVKGFTEV